MKIRTAIFMVLILLCGIAFAAEDGEFASLKKKQVNWRAGPGEKYPIRWIYQEQGYPVKILDTYDIWKQVQEADGSIGWVHEKMVSDKRTVLVQEDGNLTDKPALDSHTIAVVETGTIGRVIRCPAEYKYCLLSFKYQDKDIKGWFPRQAVWGLYPDEEID